MSEVRGPAGSGSGVASLPGLQVYRVLTWPFLGARGGEGDLRLIRCQSSGVRAPVDPV